MMFRDMIQSGVRMANANAPALLTAFGAAGTVTTAVLTGKAAYNSHERILEAQLAKTGAPEPGTNEVMLEKLDKLEIVKAVWPLYIPAATSGTVTIAAIILSHRVSARRAAALAAAYAMSEGRLEEYQDKVKEKFGLKKEEEVRSELTQERVNRDYDEVEVILTPYDGKVLIREDYTGRFFWSSIEEVEKAVNEVNAHVISEGSARLSDFYNLIGLSQVSTSDYFGFVQDNRMELDWNTSTTPDGKTAVHTFEYVNHPVMDPENEARHPFR